MSVLYEKTVYYQCIDLLDTEKLCRFNMVRHLYNAFSFNQNALKSLFLLFKLSKESDNISKGQEHNEKSHYENTPM